MRFYLVNACTSLNLFLGLGALFLASIGEITYASILLLASVGFDACDGFLARKWGVSSEFGAQLDSLGDFASFCIASGALSYYWFSPGLPHWLMAIAAGAYILLGAIRLARYNSSVDPICPPAYFEGMPTTAASAMLAMFCLATPELNCWVGLAITVVLGALMVCKLPYPKLTKMTWMPFWAWLVPFACAAVFFSASIWFFCVIYLCSGPVVAWRQRGQQAVQS